MLCVQSQGWSDDSLCTANGHCQRRLGVWIYLWSLHVQKPLTIANLTLTTPTFGHMTPCGTTQFKKLKPTKPGVVAHTYKSWTSKPEAADHISSRSAWGALWDSVSKNRTIKPWERGKEYRQRCAGWSQTIYGRSTGHLKRRGGITSKMWYRVVPRSQVLSEGTRDYDPCYNVFFLITISSSAKWGMTKLSHFFYKRHHGRESQVTHVHCVATHVTRY